MERLYDHSLISYVSEEKIKAVLLLHSRQIAHYAYIFHDKDESVPHWHICLVLSTGNACPAQRVKKWFADEQNTLVEPMIDRGAMFTYLTHKDDKSIMSGKADYSIDSIRCDNLEWWTSKVDKPQGVDRSVQIIDDIINKVPFRQMCLKYGRDFVINYERYKQMAHLIRSEEWEPSPKLIEKLQPIVDDDGVVNNPFPDCR